MTEAELLVIEERFAEAKAEDDRFSPARQASFTELFAHGNVPALIAEVRRLLRANAHLSFRIEYGYFEDELP